MAARTNSQTKKKTLIEWANSKQTERAIKHAFKLTEKSIEPLRKARRINTEILHKPVTM